jgi:hypothetical protein
MRRFGVKARLEVLIRLAIAAAGALHRRADRTGAARAHSRFVFEGTVVLLKEVAPPEQDGTREFVATFRVHRPASADAPKFVVLQTSVPVSEALRIGASYLVQASAEGATPAAEPGGCTVRSLRDARVELTPIPCCAAA